MYSYNQLTVILDYFSGIQPLSLIDGNLKQVFQGCEVVNDAKQQLLYLGCENFSKDLWKVAKTLDWRKSSKLSKIETKGVEIVEGNIIKMGRLKLKAKTMQLTATGDKKNNGNNKAIVNQDDEAIDPNQDISVQFSERTDDIPPCRFCLSNEMDNASNPLVNPCNCKGTQGLIHIECLRSWMTSKRTHKVFSPTSEMYTWRTMNCELCSAPYPFKVCFDGQNVSLLEYEEPEGRYLSFETFLKEGCAKSTSKSLYIVRLNQLEKYRVGRSHEVEFHIEDISVSRVHAELVITSNQKVLVKDVKSKFGTQILSKGAKPLDYKDSTQNMYQIGRTWFMGAYQEKKKKSGFLCCLGGKPKNVSVPDTKANYEVEEESHYFLDKRLVTKLENDIENLQKDRDSVFYLDDEFYHKLMTRNNRKEDESHDRKQTSIMAGAANETVDECRRVESKSSESELSSSYASGEAGSSSVEPDESGVSSSRYSSINHEDSTPGIGISNKNCSLISKGTRIEIKKPS